MGDLLQPWHLIVLSIIFVFPTIIVGVIPFWFICKKAGFSPALSLLNLVPFCLGTLVLVYFLAFANWKPLSEREAANQLPS
jgi:hypothetical protein